LIPKKSGFPACDYQKLKALVKTAFNQRRKTMRNSLKSVLSPEILSAPLFTRRPEELVWQEFEEMMKLLD
jgi:16S rRNA (adenine1518-N6/adenine1519-N6)-dimethyltransferase